MVNKETQAYKNKLKYIAEYKKKNNRNVSLLFDIKKDKEVLEWLDKQPNKTGYIRQLVLEDIKRNR